VRLTQTKLPKRWHQDNQLESGSFSQRYLELENNYMEWYYLDNQKQQIGPSDEADIKNLAANGAIKKTTMVWNESLENWLPACDSSLGTLFAASKTPPPAPNPAPAKTPPSHMPDPTVAFGRDDTLVYPTNPPRSPHMAWLNFMGPGLAQIVFGKTWLGIASIISVNFTILVTSAFGKDWIGGWFYLALMIASIVDAYMSGNRLREGQPVGKWQVFPTKK
jgi:TM2 domain-containing membrane protein YozV